MNDSNVVAPTQTPKSALEKLFGESLTSISQHSPTDAELAVREAINRYKKERSVINRYTDPLRWWYDNTARHPILHGFA